ncbi:hypothetical protein APR41_09115 [Salegentibacter salinarum]|uniref:Lipoprotein n=1 Tax=Salegentibacter salinarum TaxID=447422 RepID=A0A2N0TP29_9FLAO|nr:hypothetical protein [Salegentibacter salinarum]PKD16491.1 hypothetical protein APR41_09115 [Salegentibacter salinarum]SKB64884.1 hypothetical protein SAMN05660903_01857 [Salegentibacter salinarum]
MKLLLKFLLRSIGVMLITGGLCGCVKDVDLDQREEISLSPDVQIDLLIYDIDQSQFKDPSTGNLKTHISDTVRLEFLDDDYIQEDLTTVEFYFRHINTFPREIESKIRFLSDGNREQFAVNYTIKPGVDGNPVTTEQFEFIEEDRIHLVRRTIKMVVELEVQPGSAKFEGELDFASKGLFSFEF